MPGRRFAPTPADVMSKLKSQRPGSLPSRPRAACRQASSWRGRRFRAKSDAKSRTGSKASASIRNASTASVRNISTRHWQGYAPPSTKPGHRRSANSDRGVTGRRSFSIGYSQAHTSMTLAAQAASSATDSVRFIRSQEVCSVVPMPAIFRRFYLVSPEDSFFPDSGLVKDSSCSAKRPETARFYPSPAREAGSGRQS
jgi:hypothetical protein